MTGLPNSFTTYPDLASAPGLSARSAGAARRVDKLRNKRFADRGDNWTLVTRSPHLPLAAWAAFLIATLPGLVMGLAGWPHFVTAGAAASWLWLGFRQIQLSRQRWHTVRRLGDQIVLSRTFGKPITISFSQLGEIHVTNPEQPSNPWHLTRIDLIDGRSIRLFGPLAAVLANGVIRSHPELPLKKMVGPKVQIDILHTTRSTFELRRAINPGVFAMSIVTMPALVGFVVWVSAMSAKALPSPAFRSNAVVHEFATRIPSSNQFSKSTYQSEPCQIFDFHTRENWYLDAHRESYVRRAAGPTSLTGEIQRRADAMKLSRHTKQSADFPSQNEVEYVQKHWPITLRVKVVPTDDLGNVAVESKLFTHRCVSGSGAPERVKQDAERIVSYLAGFPLDR
jgi:hypothetical protein